MNRRDTVLGPLVMELVPPFGQEMIREDDADGIRDLGLFGLNVLVRQTLGRQPLDQDVLEFMHMVGMRRVEGDWRPV